MGERLRNLGRVDRFQNPFVAPVLDVEVSVHVLCGDNRGQQRLILGCEVAGGEVVPADDASDRRGDPGVTQVEFGAVQHCLGRLDAGLGFLDGRLVLVDLELADHPRGTAIPLVNRLGEVERCLVQHNLALGLLDERLIGPRVDLEQQVSFLNLGPFLKRHLREEPGGSGANTDRLNCVRPSGVVGEVGHVSFHEAADGDGRRCAGRRVLLLSLAPDHAYEKQPEQERESHKAWVVGETSPG